MSSLDFSKIYMTTFYDVKDGKNIITYKKTVDTSKPKIYTEGFEYKFNWTIEKVAVNGVKL